MVDKSNGLLSLHTHSKPQIIITLEKNGPLPACYTWCSTLQKKGYLNTGSGSYRNPLIHEPPVAPSEKNWFKILDPDPTKNIRLLTLLHHLWKNWILKYNILIRPNPKKYRRIRNTLKNGYLNTGSAPLLWHPRKKNPYLKYRIRSKHPNSHPAIAPSKK